MYTPRGELREGILEALEDEQVLDQLKLCETREEYLFVMRNYAKDLTFEELLDSMVVVQSYLDEEVEKRIQAEMLQTSKRGQAEAIVRGKVGNLLDDDPGKFEKIWCFFRKMQAV